MTDVITGKRAFVRQYNPPRDYDMGGHMTLKCRTFKLSLRDSARSRDDPTSRAGLD
jgi:hypothetical protein